MARRHEPRPQPDLHRRRPADLEVHALDVALGDDLYGATVEVAFAERLRDEQRFSSADALAAQIARDIAAARPRLTPAWLAGAVLGLDTTCDEDHV